VLARIAFDETLVAQAFRSVFLLLLLLGGVVVVPDNFKTELGSESTQAPPQNRSWHPRMQLQPFF